MNGVDCPPPCIAVLAVLVVRDIVVVAILTCGRSSAKGRHATHSPREVQTNRAALPQATKQVQARGVTVSERSSVWIESAVFFPGVSDGVNNEERIRKVSRAAGQLFKLQRREPTARVRQVNYPGG
jgi:hypothetical protein